MTWDVGSVKQDPAAGELIRWRGRWDARHAIGAADIHSHSAWRFAPAIQRMQRTAVLAENHRDPLTADPRRRYTSENYQVRSDVLISMKTSSDNSLIDLRNREKINHRIPLIVAHRGGVVSPTSPENTLAAIRFASEGSYDMVEIDIAEAMDCEPVLFHSWNGNLRSSCGLDSFVYDMTSEELVKIKYRESDECITSLSQALKLCRELDLGVMLDIKEFGGQHHSEEFFSRIAKLVIKNGLVNSSLTFSQNPFGYKHLRNVLKFAISEDELVLFSNGQRNIVEGRWWFALPNEVTDQLLIDLQENGTLVIVAINQFRYPVHAHEIIASKDVQRLIDTGVDGLQIDSIYEGFVDSFLNRK